MLVIEGIVCPPFSFATACLATIVYVEMEIKAHTHKVLNMTIMLLRYLRV